MFYLTYTMISSIGLAHYGVSPAEDLYLWIAFQLRLSVITVISVVAVWSNPSRQVVLLSFFPIYQITR